MVLTDAGAVRYANEVVTLIPVLVEDVDDVMRERAPDGIVHSRHERVDGLEAHLSVEHDSLRRPWILAQPVDVDDVRERRRQHDTLRAAPADARREQCGVVVVNVQEENFIAALVERQRFE